MQVDAFKSIEQSPLLKDQSTFIAISEKLLEEGFRL